MAAGSTSKRVRTPDGQQELELPSLAAGQREDWLGRWAMNQMLINVSTRRFRRSVRLPDGDVASAKGDGTSKSAVSRKFVALSSAKLKDWLATDLSPLDLLAIQIDGLHVHEDLILVAAVGIDATGEKHPLGLVEGATENAATVQALLDNLVERGLDPAVVRLFIIDGAKALSKAIRRTFGRNTPIQRCQVHTIRTQSSNWYRIVSAPWRRTAQWNDMADLQCVFSDDDALDDELQDGLPLGKRGILQSCRDAFAKGRQACHHLPRLGALPA